MAQSATAPNLGRIPGVELDHRTSMVQRVTILVLTIGPFVGFALAVYMLWGHGMSGIDLTLLISFYLFSGLGITVGYHRLFTHRSFEAPPWLRSVFAIAGSMAVEGSVIGWVADHRRHHAFADKDGDPHSPHLEEGDGIKPVIKGLWHAHIGWFFNQEATNWERWAPDMCKDPAMVRIDRAFPALMGLSFGLPALIGYLATGTLIGTFTAFLWGAVVRVFLLHHITWSVNSICHFYGRRPYKTTDMSTNNWILSFISFGESWHNTHHAFPTSAIHGIRWWQVDLGGALIKTLERLRVISDVKRPTPKQLEKALQS